MERAKIKAQPFDCMQYFYGSAQEPLIRTLIRFDRHMNEDILKKAVYLSMNVIPLIRCCFDEKEHCWKKSNFMADDIVHVAKVHDDEDDITEKLLLSSIDIAHEPQLKVFLVKNSEYDTLCIIINHMVSDGGGFKEYLYMLAYLYSQVEKDTNFSIKLKDYKRNLGQILENLSFREKLNILFSRNNSHKLDPNFVLPLKGDKSKSFIAVRRLKEELFLNVKSFAKNRNASINDMFLTAYIRALNKLTGYTSIAVPCPVDLRKYKSIGQICGICNLTGNYICHAVVGSNDKFCDTLKNVSSEMKTNKESDNCLKGPMLFHMLFHMLPFNIIRKLFYKISPVPVTSYTNLGVIDDKRFHFGGLGIYDAFISTAVKYAPYFQVSISTYVNCCTVTSSFHGTKEDKRTVEKLLDYMINEFRNLV